jgi:hypothetical protein
VPALTHSAAQARLYTVLCPFLPCCAALVAAELASRGVKLEFVVDEGTSIVMDGLPPLYSSPVALVATAEKVYVQVEVRA